MQYSKILELNLPEDGDSADVAKLNENFESLEAATYVIDRLAATYGYSLTTSTSGNVTTTTLTVDSASPYTATRKTVETVSDGSTTYAVTVTIDDETHTMTHTVGTTTGSGATTDGGGDIIPFEVMISKMGRLEASVDDALSTTVADLEQDISAVQTDVDKLLKQWVYLSENYAYTCQTPSDTSTKPYTYTETVKNGGTTLATLVTTCNADGSYKEVLTVGEDSVERVTSKSGNTYTRGAWS